MSDQQEELKVLKARCARLQQLLDVTNVINATLDPDETMRSIVAQATRLTRATSGSAVLINPTTGFMEIEAAQGLPSRARKLKLRVGEGITGWVARTGKPARIGNVKADPRYVMIHPDVQSELAVPLEVNGEVRGVLNVDSTESDAFNAEDQELLELLAGQAAGVIHNTWMFEQARLKARLLESLAKLSQSINSNVSLDETLQGITHQARTLMSARISSLMLLDEQKEWLDLRASSGAGEAYLKKPRLSVSESLLGTVIRRKKALQVENVQTSSQYQHVELARREGLISLLSAPLVYLGEAIGVINIYTGTPHSFSNEEVRILSMLAELSAIAIERARLHERLVDLEEQLRQNEQLSALGLLAAEVAHEIRNPLTVLKMLFHSLNLNFPETDPRSQDVRVMEQKMELLNKIVEQILDFARHSEPKLEPVQLNRLVEDLALLTRHKLRNPRIECVRELAEDLPPVMGDATQIEQAFLNLTLNAIQAMPEGGRLLIRTRLVPEDREAGEPRGVEVVFEDNGEGMDTEQRDRAFSSLLSSSKPKGTGIGLRIVRRVVETHRGRLDIRSEPGVGTAVAIRIPADPEPAHEPIKSDDCQ